jgi:hypothetical protein
MTLHQTSCTSHIETLTRCARMGFNAVPQSKVGRSLLKINHVIYAIE